MFRKYDAKNIYLISVFISKCCFIGFGVILSIVHQYAIFLFCAFIMRMANGFANELFTTSTHVIRFKEFGIHVASIYVLHFRFFNLS